MWELWYVVLGFSLQKLETYLKPNKQFPHLIFATVPKVMKKVIDASR